MSIYQKYETEADLVHQKRIGANFIKLFASDLTLQELGGLSTYDFKLLKDNQMHGWLEVKKKSGSFGELEMIPVTKWSFAEKSPFPCWMIIEREDEARVFDVTKIVTEKLGEYKEITRRPDQPEGSKKVYIFKSGLGSFLYKVPFEEIKPAAEFVPEPLPWETEPIRGTQTPHGIQTEPMQKPENLCKPTVNPELQEVNLSVKSETVVKPPEPQKKSLEWMKLHLRELITLRAGRTYKPEIDPQFEAITTQAELIFGVK